MLIHPYPPQATLRPTRPTQLNHGHSQGILAIMPWLTALLGPSASPAPSMQSKPRPSHEVRQSCSRLPGTPDITDFSPQIRGKVLLLADAENISYTLRNEGFDCNFGVLRQRVSQRVGALHAHAFATVKGESACQYAQDYFAREQWTPHINTATTVQTQDGTRLRANSDNEILMCAGELISRIQPDTLVIATGDGDLGCDIAQYFQRRNQRAQVLVCSVKSSTSHRLLATNNPKVKANVWLGWDCIAKAQ